MQQVAQTVVWSIINPLIITSIIPPIPIVGQSYSFQCTAIGGSGNYRWSIGSGTLPSGITLSQNGLLSGIPTVAGDYTFTLVVSDF